MAAKRKNQKGGKNKPSKPHPDDRAPAKLVEGAGGIVTLELDGSTLTLEIDPEPDEEITTIDIEAVPEDGTETSHISLNDSPMNDGSTEQFQIDVNQQGLDDTKTYTIKAKVEFRRIVETDKEASVPGVRPDSGMGSMMG